MNTQAYDSLNYDPAASVLETRVRRAATGGSEISLQVLVDSGADISALPIDVLQSVGARYLDVRQMRGTH